MSADRDMTRAVRSWLRTDEHESADRVLDNVFAELDATPQRPSWRPAWRIDPMNTHAKLAIAAAAALVVAVVGFNLLPDLGGAGGPTSPPAATPTPTVSAPPLAFPAAGELAIGRHSLTVDGVTFTIEITESGWLSDGAFWISREEGVTPEGGAILFWSPESVFADPCAHTTLNPPLGPTTADFADAITDLPGIDNVTQATDIAEIFGGASDYRQIVIREDAACTAESFWLAYQRQDGSGGGGMCEGVGVCPRYASQLGSKVRFWIVDRGGSRLVIEAETYKGADEAAELRIVDVVDSILFE